MKSRCAAQGPDLGRGCRGHPARRLSRHPLVRRHHHPASAAGAVGALTARRVLPALPLAKQRRVCGCYRDNEEESETNDVAHALLT